MLINAHIMIKHIKQQTVPVMPSTKFWLSNVLITLSDGNNRLSENKLPYITQWHYHSPSIHTATRSRHWRTCWHPQPAPGRLHWTRPKHVSVITTQSQCQKCHYRRSYSHRVTERGQRYNQFTEQNPCMHSYINSIHFWYAPEKIWIMCWSSIIPH